MSTKTFIGLLEDQDYRGSISIFLGQFQSYIKQNKLSGIRNLANLPEEHMKDLLWVMDVALMHQWRRILINYKYRRRESPSATIWYCDQLIDDEKLIEAEELLKDLEKEDLSPELAEKLYFNMAVALIHMRRFREGYFYMKKCEKASENSMNTRWAYYYLNKGEWSTALRLLEKGKKDQKDSALAYTFLVQHYSMQGDMMKAGSYLEEGLKKHPHYPKLLAEKIRFHYSQKQWHKMRETIALLDHISPYHDNKKLYDYYVAEAYYEEEKLSLLHQHLASHPDLTKHTHFKHFDGNKNKGLKKLNYKPVVQKYNFCVPAGIEMALSMFSYEISQDEIAESIFDVTGTKISKAIDYLEENGFYCRLFHGNEERFKSLIDQSIAVMITIDYPTSSHIQILTGYDDNLQVFHIQDPNFREPHHLEYKDFEKELGNNFALSVAIVPANEADKLHFLDNVEHETNKKLLLLTEECNHSLEQEDLMFLENNKENPLVAVYAVKYLANFLDTEFLEKLIEVTERHISDSQYRNLIIAMAYVTVKKEKNAFQCLEKLGRKDDPTYHYLKGRLYDNKGDYFAACNEFKKGIKNEPDDYILWSYLAISTSNHGQYKDALRFSKIALDINNRDIFPITNHGMILFDNEQYAEARNFFTTALKMKKDDALVWYERARCDNQLGRHHKAERGFKVSIRLDPKVSFPYRELANLYEFAYEDMKMAEEVLKNGLMKTDNDTLLLQELGELYERNKEYDKARIYYTKAAEKVPEDPEAFISLAFLLKEEEKISEFFSYITKIYDQFKDHNEFLINIGKIIWETAMERELDETYFKQALTYMEQGIRKTASHLEEALELYTGLIEDTPFYRRGIEFLECERENREDDFLLLCYIGSLYENNGYLAKARSYYKRALAMKEDVLPLYRLGDIYSKFEDVEKAKGYYHKVLGLDPCHEQALLDLANIASLQENKLEELHYLMEAFRINPYCVSVEAIIELMDQPSMLEDFLQKFRDLDKKKYEKEFIYDSMAYIYGKLGNIKEEEAYLTKALEHSPELPELRHHQVKLFIKKGDLKKAKNECLQAIQENFHNREWYETLVDIYSKTKSLAQIENDLKKLKLTKKEKSIVFMHSAAAYEKMVADLMEDREDHEGKGLFKKLTGFTKLSFHIGTAVTLYETAIKLDPENSTATDWLSDFYLQMSSSEDAIKVLEKTIKIQWNPDLAYKLASLYVNERVEISEKKQMKYLFKAQNIMETLVEEYDEPEYMNLLGLILFLQGKLKDAEAVYVKCLDIEPGVDRGYFHLAKVYAEMEDYPNAELAMKKALELLPEDIEALNELGIIYRLQERAIEALECVDDALKLQGDDLYVKYNRACYLSLLGRFEESAKQLGEVFALDEEGIFLEMSVDDIDLLPLKEAGLFPQEGMAVN
ncbi:hypothetical protein DCC39_12020 [Pueribacillus theae]|uniref:Peptidase C39-like domain-containing protein n=1 Tax=Pueribacillus theae TaxID=2171751 RepID=A0A2U1JXR4_9BACI|nr:tetratricopeptide repeat protein [Pueribacillus theae]PWA10007.1 hypothetical protein DCC39_12020 [Pueribacillus theae]